MSAVDSVPDLMSVVADPRNLALDGRITDTDSHEMIPTHYWDECFGEVGVELGKIMEHHPSANTLYLPDITGDEAAIDFDSVWATKGPRAPSAIDMARRPAVLDQMGIKRQLVFPTFALAAVIMACDPDAHLQFGYDPATIDRMDFARRAIDSHNRWAGRMAREVDTDRLRVVGVGYAETAAQLISQTEAMIDDGIRAIWIPGALPPGGLSPADKELDPFWKACADANVSVTLHIGTEFSFVRTHAWSRGVPEFVPANTSSIEFPIEPYRGATMHFTQENFLVAMILGGVFERFPTLRFGVIECAAHWVGPLAESIDIWGEEFARRLTKTLSMRPSEYLARNVRVNPYVFEPVDRYYDRYPELGSVYCYSSDFPHREGGLYSRQTFFEKMSRFADETLEKFFVTNGQLLMPD